MPAETVPAVVARLRDVQARGVTRPVAWRLAQLDALAGMISEHRSAIEQALHDDLGKSAEESRVTEIAVVQGELRDMQRHLRRWLRPSPASVPAVAQPGRAWTVLEPLGVALVIAPWNYPLQLTLGPLIGALAAGDTVVLKPSELAPATSRLLAGLLPRSLDARAVAVVQGGKEETTQLLAERFDVIFYTGGARVGRIVAAAAAEHLTPTVLELGGKSPVWVDATADLDIAAGRIAWGKFMNAGQTCVAPDYLLATPAVARDLVPRIEQAVRRMYGDTPNRSAVYPRIVSEQQFDRLQGLLGDGSPAFGGGADRDSLRIEPTVLTGVDPESAVMSEEIFGPILPVVEVDDERAAIAFVTGRPKPLALYVFTEDAAARRRWLARTSSGGIVFGVPNLQLGVPAIPFGGVGESGMGSYHGRRSLLAFSHEKAVFVKPARPDTVRLYAPPFTGLKSRLIDRITR